MKVNKVTLMSVALLSALTVTTVGCGTKKRNNPASPAAAPSTPEQKVESINFIDRDENGAYKMALTLPVGENGAAVTFIGESVAGAGASNVTLVSEQLPGAVVEFLVVNRNQDAKDVQVAQGGIALLKKCAQVVQGRMFSIDASTGKPADLTLAFHSGTLTMTMEQALRVDTKLAGKTDVSDSDVIAIYASLYSGKIIEGDTCPTTTEETPEQEEPQGPLAPANS